VINPQDGHILCDPYAAIGGFGLWILRRNGIANSATSRPNEILVEFSKVLLPNLGGEVSCPPFLSATACYAALPGALASGALASSVFSPPTLTLICLGLASAFLASLIFSTPLS